LIRLVPARLNSTASERSVAGCCVKGALLAHDSGLFNCSIACAATHTQGQASRLDHAHRFAKCRLPQWLIQLGVDWLHQTLSASSV
jgi:hypothetical protein